MADALKSWRHLFSAVLALGARASSVEYRLRAAYVNELQRLSPHEDLPKELRADFAALMNEIATMYNNPDRADEQKASHLAKQVVVLYDRVTRQF
ncbi:MAG: hypothetical protein ACLGHO_01280 [Gammaproteobacteria bacterium]